MQEEGDEDKEEVYTDSSAFLKVILVILVTVCHMFLNFVNHLLYFCLKHQITYSVLHLFQGTQSDNPHNDYCQNFVDTGERPQNYIRDVGK